MKVNDNMSFYKNQSGKIEHNEKCKNCPKECKQSFRAELLTCSKLREEVKGNDT